MGGDAQDGLEGMPLEHHVLKSPRTRPLERWLPFNKRACEGEGSRNKRKTYGKSSSCLELAHEWQHFFQGSDPIGSGT